MFLIQLRFPLHHFFFFFSVSSSVHTQLYQINHINLVVLKETKLGSRLMLAVLAVLAGPKQTDGRTGPNSSISAHSSCLSKFVPVISLPYWSWSSDILGHLNNILTHCPLQVQLDPWFLTRQQTWTCFAPPSSASLPLLNRLKMGSADETAAGLL